MGIVCPLFSGHIKENCLDQMILIGENSLKRTVGEYVEHYNTERTHQALENNIIEPKFGVMQREREVESRKPAEFKASANSNNPY
ncbi:hypothetical protein N9B94_01750 [Verrucomicrobia bacterium]|nr:hypothetical protein [Verrucomicrobiota bacterium]